MSDDSYLHEMSESGLVEAYLFYREEDRRWRGNDVHYRQMLLIAEIAKQRGLWPRIEAAVREAKQSERHVACPRCGKPKRDTETCPWCVFRKEIE